MKAVEVIGDGHLAQVAREGFVQRGFTVIDSSTSRAADWVVVAIDTPVREDGDSDLDVISKAVWQCAPDLLPYTPVIVMSQVRVRTCEALEARARQINTAWQSGVVYVPENLKLTDGAARFLEPDMLVMGSDHAKALRGAMKLFETWTCPKLTMSLRSAEMVKHAINGWLALNINYANAIAKLSHSVGADEVSVAIAMRMDRRMEKAPLRPGPAVPKQGTLGRDVYSLQQLCAEFGMEPCVK